MKSYSYLSYFFFVNNNLEYNPPVSLLLQRIVACFCQAPWLRTHPGASDREARRVLPDLTGVARDGDAIVSNNSSIIIQA